ncbi:MAG: phage integrase N-terminal SAM-like domain-containing protein, partial [Gammaproteobacteria bacterium]|nr:phage integrase N-terminal SAM-like domain-containing protein [Gammaproteobacteria bacterium]
EAVACAYLQEAGLRPRTEESYLRIAALFDREVQKPVPAVTVDDVSAWRDRLFARGVSAVTWNTNRRHLNALMNWCVSAGHATENPFARVRSIPVTPDIVRTKIVRPEHLSHIDPAH